MSKFYLGFITAVIVFISLDTLRRLYTERYRFSKEDLSEYDVSFGWRIVIFVICPLLNLLALWVSIVACQWFGGYVKALNYGLLWYQVIPGELASKHDLLLVLFSGELAQIFFVLLAMLALFFRPHPFLSMIITYSCAFVLGINLIADPLLSTIDLGSAHWQTIINNSNSQQLTVFIVAHLLFACVYLAILKSERVAMLFARLIRPMAVERLQNFLAEMQSTNSSTKNLSQPVLASNLILLYEAAGLKQSADRKLRIIKKQYTGISVFFTEAYINYCRHKYKVAGKLFMAAADACVPEIDRLKSMLLAAAACCAQMNQNYEDALNLVERSLEFDHYSPMARIIKMDILLRQGKEKRAAEELKTFMWEGLNQNIEQSVPIDWNQALKLINECETSKVLSTIGNKA
jgi:tetratricopeptide (TPR) repeat protein